MQVPDNLLPACATWHGQAQLFLQVPALRPPGAVLGRMRVIACLWDGTPRYSLLDGGVGGGFPSCSSSCVVYYPCLNLALLGPCRLNEVEPLSGSLLLSFVCLVEVVFLPVDFPGSWGGWWKSTAGVCCSSPGRRPQQRGWGGPACPPRWEHFAELWPQGAAAAAGQGSTSPPRCVATQGRPARLPCLLFSCWDCPSPVAPSTLPVLMASTNLIRDLHLLQDNWWGSRIESSPTPWRASSTPTWLATFPSDHSDCCSSAGFLFIWNMPDWHFIPLIFNVM